MAITLEQEQAERLLIELREFQQTCEEESYTDTDRLWDILSPVLDQYVQALFFVEVRAENADGEELPMDCYALGAIEGLEMWIDHYGLAEEPTTIERLKRSIPKLSIRLYPLTKPIGTKARPIGSDEEICGHGNPETHLTWDSDELETALLATEHQILEFDQLAMFQ